MAEITKTYQFSAPVSEVWRALVDVDVIEQWSGAPAEMLADPGGRFSMWAGDIYGTVTEVDPQHRLVEEWFGGPWDQPSIATFTLEATEDGTTLTLEHTNVPDDEAPDFAAGWDDYYLGAIKELLDRR